MYHRVLPDDHPYFLFAALSGEVVRESVFLAQMQWLKSNFVVLTLSQLMQYQGRARAVAITFDDGLVDNWRYALPVLEGLALPATLFVLAGQIGSGNGFAHHQAARQLATHDGLPLAQAKPRDQLRAYLQRSDSVGEFVKAEHPDDRFLNPEEVAQMARRGVSIQSHGMTHTPMARLSPAERLEELRSSKHILSELSDQEVNYFAFPVGRAQHLSDGRHIKQAGYAAAFSAMPQRLTSRSDVFALPRQGVRNSLDKLQRKL